MDRKGTSAGLSVGITTQPIYFWGRHVACWHHEDREASLVVKRSMTFMALCDDCAQSTDGVIEPIERVRARLAYEAGH